MGLANGRLPGNYRAKVLVNNDPDLFGRVKVWIPDIMPELEEIPENCLWAYPANNPMGGRNEIEETETQYYNGSCYIPAVGSYVWVFFEGMNINTPFYFGSLDIQCSPVLSENQSGSEPWNKWTIFKSKEGRCIVISDDPSDCRVEITGKKRNINTPPAGDIDSVFEIQENQTTILLEETDGNERLLIKTHKGDYINVDVSNQKLNAYFKKGIDIKSDGNINISAGRNINLKASKQMYVTGSALTHIKSSGIVAIDGSQTRIQQGMAQMAVKANPNGERSTNATGTPANHSPNSQEGGGLGFDSAQKNALAWSDSQSTEGNIGDASGGTGPPDPSFAPSNNDFQNLGKSYSTWLTNTPVNTWQSFKDQNGLPQMQVMRRGTGILDFRLPGTTEVLKSFHIPTSISALGLNFDVSGIAGDILTSFGKALWDGAKDLLGFHMEGFMQKFGGMIPKITLPKIFNISQWGNSINGLGDINSTGWKNFIPKLVDFSSLGDSFLGWANTAKRGVLNAFYDQAGNVMGNVMTNWSSKTRKLSFSFFDANGQNPSKVLSIGENNFKNKSIIQTLGSSLWSEGKDKLGSFMSYYMGMSSGKLKPPDYNNLLPIDWKPDDIIPPPPGNPQLPTAPSWMYSAVGDVKNFISVTTADVYIDWPGNETHGQILYGYRIKYRVLAQNAYELSFEKPNHSQKSCNLDYEIYDTSYLAGVLWDWADSNIRSSWEGTYNRNPPVIPPDPPPEPSSGEWTYTDAQAPRWVQDIVDPFFSSYINNTGIANGVFEVWPGQEAPGSALHDYRFKKSKHCGGRYTLTWSKSPTFHDHPSQRISINQTYAERAQILWAWADVTIRQTWGAYYATN